MAIKLGVDFEWQRAFSTASGAPAYEFKDGEIRQRGRVEEETIRPLTLRPTLYLDFAQLDGSPDACLQFARRWGLLTIQFFEKPKAEPIKLWKEEIGSIRFLLQGLPLADANNAQSTIAVRSLTNLGVAANVFLQQGPPPLPPSLVLRPRTLIDAIRLQMAHAFAGGVEVATCARCGSWFERGTNRRSDARFCSDTCRFKHHNARRGK
jgi:hypothetical protein